MKTEMIRAQQRAEKRAFLALDEALRKQQPIAYLRKQVEEDLRTAPVWPDLLEYCQRGARS